MKIKSIGIKNYKVFKDLNLVLNGKSVVIFGENGVGKSTVLSAMNYIFRVFLNQMNPAQSKAFERFEDEMITVGEKQLAITAEIKLDDYFLLQRVYKKNERNKRTNELTYPKLNYTLFRERFKALYLSSDDIGMPVFLHYGTNRVVLDIPDRIRERHDFDKLTAIERAIDPQTDFRTFFEWYREREAEEVLRIKDSKDFKYEDLALACVRRAIESMIGDVKALQIKRNPTRMVVYKGDKEIRVDMLSDGEKCTLALLGDLARRLILANPGMDNPLEGSGIVLIDEIELHMHPAWQRRILNVLREVFPNIQFVLSTHSPQVLGEADTDFDIISLTLDENGYGVADTSIRRMDGYDSNLILEDYMGASSRSEKKKQLVHDINRSIVDHEFEKAEAGLMELKELSGEDDEDYILARASLRRRRGI